MNRREALKALAIGGAAVLFPSLNKAFAAQPTEYAKSGNFLSIQLALNRLPLTGGVVRVPAGTYYRSTYTVNGVTRQMPPIQLKSNQTLMPAENVSSVTDCKIVTLLPGNVIQSYEADNVAVYGLFLKAYGPAIPDGERCRAIAFWGVHNGVIASCQISDFRYSPGISIAGDVAPSRRGAKNISIRDNYVYGTYNHSGISLYQLVDACEVKNNLVLNCGYSGILLDNEVDYCLVENNTVKNCGFNNVLLSDGKNRSYSGIAVDNAAFNKVRYNEIFSCAKDGITVNVSGQVEDKYPAKGDSNSVAYNIVRDCKLNGIRIQGLGTSDQVEIYAKYNWVYANTCTGNANAGVLLSRTRNTTVTLNTCLNNGVAISDTQGINNKVS